MPANNITVETKVYSLEVQDPYNVVLDVEVPSQVNLEITGVGLQGPEGPPGPGGTVESVALTAPTGFDVTGSPVTTTGTLSLSFSAGYSLPTDASQANWDTAYSWGDHALAGYLLESTFNASPAGGITSTQVTNWDTAYSWGDHALAGYLTDAPSDGEQYARQDGAWSVVSGGGLNALPVNVIGVTASNQTLDVSTYSAFEIEPSGPITLTFTGLPLTDRSISYVSIVNGGDDVIMYSSNVIWENGPPALTPSFIGYDINNASYDAVSFSIAAQAGFPYCFAYNSDRSKIYVLDNTSDSIYQYSLSTPGDLSTISYDSLSFSVAGQDTTPTGIALSPDDTKIYICGSVNKRIFQYSMSTASDLSTIAYDSISFDISAQLTNAAFQIYISSDYSKMYIVGGSSTPSVFQYSVSDFDDISLSSYDSESFNVSSQESDPTGLAFNGNMTKMYVIGSGSGSVHQYTVADPAAISNSSYDTTNFSVAAQETNPRSILFNDNGEKMIIVGNVNDTIYQYTTGTGVTGDYVDILSFTQYGSSKLIGKLESSGVQIS